MIEKAIEKKRWKMMIRTVAMIVTLIGDRCLAVQRFPPDGLASQISYISSYPEDEESVTDDDAWSCRDQDGDGLQIKATLKEISEEEMKRYTINNDGFMLISKPKSITVDTVIERLVSEGATKKASLITVWNGTCRISSSSSSPPPPPPPR